MTDALLQYVSHLNANQEVLTWLQTTGAKSLKLQKATESDLEHILDFLVSPAAPQRLLKMSFVDAKRKAKEWSEKNQKKGRNLIDNAEDVQVIHDFLDGTAIMQLKTKKALQREGFLMNHCVGSYTLSNDCHIYSYRDGKNMPHATFEVRKSGNKIMQIKGKGNGPIHPKYIHPILAFLKSIGMSIRPSDMSNLGYYHVSKPQLEMLKKFKGLEKQTVVISGETYAF